jgi:uncharacterized protein (DUF362 family)
MDRRDFIKTTAAAGIFGAAFGPLLGASKKSKTGEPDLIAVRNGTPAEMFARGIKELGGMEKFVKKGQTVVVKPNIGWAKKPELAANTHPELVAAIIKACYAAGAKKVYVFDHTCNYWRSCYNLSGIQKAAKSAGADVMPGNSIADYRDVKVPEGKKLTHGKVHRLIQECDVFINVPILKNHGGAVMTSAMKNLMGTVWDRRYFHRNDLQQCIADWITYRKPDLNIVDAYNIMVEHGPRGISLDDVVNKKFQLFSRDIVAVDTAAAKIIGIPTNKIPYLKYGEQLKLGTMDLDKLNIRRITL